MDRRPSPSIPHARNPFGPSSYPTIAPLRTQRDLPAILDSRGLTSVQSLHAKHESLPNCRLARSPGPSGSKGNQEVAVAKIIRKRRAKLEHSKPALIQPIDDKAGQRLRVSSVV